MRKLYAKLLKHKKNKTLKSSMLDINRDSDAFIAYLFGWRDIGLDTNKEWIGDSPKQNMLFKCIGRCVIPKFTSSDGLFVLDYIKVANLIKNTDRVEIFYTNESEFSAILKTKRRTLQVTASSLSLLFCRLFVEIKK